MTPVEHLIVAEELGRVAAPEGINTVGVELVGPILLGAGTEAQKRRYLPRILSGEEVWCQGFSEPGAGSDLAGLRTAARPDGGEEWVVEGQKIWTTQGHFADWCILLARTDPAAPKHKGLTLFLLPMRQPGITVRPLVDISGKHEVNQVFFDGARVPPGCVVGPVNEGWQTANKLLVHERGTNRIYRQARFAHEFRHMLRLAMEPDAGGARRAADDPVLRDRLAEAWIDLLAHRCHNWKLVSRITAAEPIGAEVSFIKLYWSLMHQRLAALGLDVLGGDAVLTGPHSRAEGRFPDLYLQSRAETVYAGTVQIQRNIIAERVLGLPR
jgi:alkylation response protein AidB-like acyl-CoA dehydrogenase